jgi:hypothetical protein
VFNPLQHLSLIVCVLDLLHLDDLSLLQDLYGVKALIVMRLNEMDPAETTGPKRTLHLEVGKRILALCFAGGIIALWVRGGLVEQRLDGGSVCLGMLRTRRGVAWCVHGGG